MKALSSVLSSVVLAAAAATPASATFSIVAVDRTTGEVGCAGASCIGGVWIIGDPVEGVGAINTQALYLETNQINARVRMLAGDSPEMIVAWLRANDASQSPEERQYGVVDLGGFGGRSAALTGTLNGEWKGHRLGPNYSIQGNILIGAQVVDRMEAAFLATEGQPLSDRLMAALAAAAFRAADRRCGFTSSLSAFIKVVRVGDGATPYLSLTSSNSRIEPIELLRTRYGEWKAGLENRVDPYRTSVSVRPPVRLADGRTLGWLVVVPRNREGKRIGSGLAVAATHLGPGTLGAFVEALPGIYGAPITAPSGETGFDAYFVTVDDGVAGPVEIARGATCRFVPARSGAR